MLSREVLSDLLDRLIENLPGEDGINASAAMWLSEDQLARVDVFKGCGARPG
jgi:hypothetical protein